MKIGAHKQTAEAKLRGICSGLCSAALLLAMMPGCQGFHQYRPVVVMARDAETQQPIPGAEVKISYPTTEPTFAPSDSYSSTGESGIARLRAAPYGESGIAVSVTAKGYMFEDKYVPVSAVEAIQPAGWFETVEKRPANFVVDVYAEPRPFVELVLPVGFRGFVKADVKVNDELPLARGQRNFTFVTSSTGEAEVVGPSLLRRVSPADFRAKFADGTPLTRSSKDSEIALWWLRSDGHTQHFLVGSKYEFDMLGKSYQGDSESHSHGGKGDSGGGRRGGRRGNQSSSDSGGTN